MPDKTALAVDTGSMRIDNDNQPCGFVAGKRAATVLGWAESGAEPRKYHVHPVDGLSHEVSEECWCEPLLLMDYGDGTRLWLHRRGNGLRGPAA